MFLAEPVLSGDLVQMAAQYTKWSAEPLHSSDIPVAVRRAFNEAKTPPTGPVFLSFPWDTMDETAEVEIVVSSQGYFRTRPDTDAVARTSELLAQASPPDAIIADEAVTSRPALMGEFSFDEPGGFYGIRDGALDVKLANPDRPVLAVVGDGASLYTVQALWTAARYNIPVVYAICNNRSYRILKVNMDIYLRRMLNDQDRQSEYTGMDFTNPLDLAAIAQGMGVAGEKMEDPQALGPALGKTYSSGRTAVIDVSIDGTL